ncbi:hypothetical protein BDZ97DRAFT_1928659 [Flammula alnicola]|nr:hypothetical protein BDZ97DRAFT_1928659 [Flammula alnicola]
MVRSFPSLDSGGHVGEMKCRLLCLQAEITNPQVAADLRKKRTFCTFSYRGVELDKLLDLSNVDFVELVHARARRCFQCGLKRRPMGLIK